MKYMLFIILIALVLIDGFNYRMNKCYRVKHSVIKAISNKNENYETGKDSWAEHLMENIFQALVDVLTPSKEIDKEKIIPQPPKFVKPLSADGWNKVHKQDGQFGYYYDDIVKNYKEKYLQTKKPLDTDVDAKLQETQNNLLPLLEELHDVKLLDEVENAINKKYVDSTSNPLLSAPGYIVEAVETSFAPLQTKLNVANVVDKPIRFRKPISLTNLRKVLSKDPEYWKK